ncbi:MAG: hypothetical protein U5K79_11030 [Cyclobacteriaceae bacterium]|nr:hypothetical protein [Cyclobacteriaceae bacterium]
MGKKLLFVITIILCAGQLIAQDGIFTIILNKGNNTLSRDNESKSITVGATVNQGQSLNVAENGYIALLHNETGSGLELNQAGEYKISDLQAAIANKENSLLSKYGKFLMTSLVSQADNSQTLNVTGAVERGSETIIPVFLPKITDVYGSELLVTWKSVDNIKDYVITVRNKVDQTIFQKNVTGNKFVLQLEGPAFAQESMFILSVQAKNKEAFSSRDFGIRRVDGTARDNIRQQYSNLLETADTENTTLGKLLIASFFEEHQLTADALSYYDSAVKTSPDPIGFAVLYESFLARNGLK